LPGGGTRGSIEVLLGKSIALMISDEKYMNKSTRVMQYDLIYLRPVAPDLHADGSQTQPTRDNGDVLWWS